MTEQSCDQNVAFWIPFTLYSWNKQSTHLSLHWRNCFSFTSLHLKCLAAARIHSNYKLNNSQFASIVSKANASFFSTVLQRKQMSACSHLIWLRSELEISVRFRLKQNKTIMADWSRIRDMDSFFCFVCRGQEEKSHVASPVQYWSEKIICVCKSDLKRFHLPLTASLHPPVSQTAASL